MTRSCNLFRLDWQQGIIVIVVTITIRATSGTQNCTGEPCMYGICMNSANGSYSCYCIDGYTGINCEINWDDCWSDPCSNGGTCNDAVASYNCTCPDGFIGSNCEVKYSECMNQPCLNNGTCIDYNGFMCQCPEGYSGDYCEIDASVCNNTMCKNSGECVEGPGFTFYCRCTEGWTGSLCDEDVDECVNSPCQNGGLCLNVPATYTCACLFGYTGKDCDKAIVPCDENPCKNEAMCLLEDSQPVCYCVPDYHGQLCELRYNDCESKNARCENGGTCIDGINNFTCSCPLEYFGEMCHEYNPTTTTITETVDNMDLTPKTYSLPTMIYYTSQETDTSSSMRSTKIYDETVTSTDSSNEDYDKSSMTTDESSIYPSLRNTSAIDARTEIENVSKSIFYTSTTPMIESNLPTTTSIIYLTALTTMSSGPKSGLVTDSTDFRTSTIPYETESTDQESPISSTEIEIFTGQSITSDEISESYDSSTIFQHETFTPKVSPEFVRTTSSPTIEITTISTKTSLINNETSTESPENRGEEETSTFFTSDITSGSESTLLDTFVTSKSVTTTDFYGESKGFTNDKIESTTFDTLESSRETSDDDFFPETEISFVTPSGKSFSSDEDATTDVTSGSTEPTRFNCSQEECILTKCPKNSTKCDCDGRSKCKDGPSIENAAFNGKSYVRQQVNIDGDGSLRIFIRLKTKSKGGVLVHALFDDERYVLLYMEGGQLKFQFSCGLQTMLLEGCKLQRSTNKNLTLIPECPSGTDTTSSRLRCLLHSHTDLMRLPVNSEDLFTAIQRPVETSSIWTISRKKIRENKSTYMTVYKTSEDSEVRLLVDTRSRIRSTRVGFQYLIGTDDIGKCSARLLVNDTMAMSGEQILSSHDNIPRQVRVHLGGIPQAFSYYFPRIAMGFIGCMSLLRVNNAPRHFIHDSTETFQIEECTSFLCLLNPCRNFGSCHDIDGQVYCKCIAGYSGTVCERSACDDNPCTLGATCISSPGTGFICVCPLGMHGLLCEEETAIVQPSFSVFIPGFSSYAAYGLTNAIKDAMELRMRLVPHSLDQISLIAFIGQSGTNRDVSDHFSLTFVRGYIMLTWDLGSGVRRIFTKSPLRTRAHRPHTLRVGRRGRDAWLSVDGLGNVTGQAAGTMTRLDVSPILYIGGHKARNFETLPHDLPLHTGFYGCIYDIELRTDDTIFPITRSSPATGRGVGECHRNECTHNACKNGALCLNHGPTYSCICMKEWEGADCSVPAVTCSSSTPYKCQKANVPL